MRNSPLEALLNKMSSMREKVYCVFKYTKTSSVTVVQRHFRTKFCKEPPHRHNISRWVKQFQDTGCLCKNTSPERKTKSEVVERIRDSFLRSPSKSTRRAVGCPSRNGEVRFTEVSPIQTPQTSEGPCLKTYSQTVACVWGPLFFAEKSINWNIYQDMLSEWLLPQLEEAVPERTSTPSLDLPCWATGFDMSSFAAEFTRSKAL
ncbi:DUF4817 domain-containing protein [Trichonephila clavipes]|nr:DUF4817 domain-containing protein [Trichonephila clavipes]